MQQNKFSDVNFFMFFSFFFVFFHFLDFKARHVMWTLYLRAN